MAEKDDRTPHILVVPYPAQGHINPMLQFSKRLHRRGAKISIVTTNFIAGTIHRSSDPPPPFPILTISDGHDDAGYAAAETIQIYLDSLRRFGSQTLRQLLRRLSSSASPVHCVVYDGFLAWVLDVAKEFQVATAVFFTQSCSVGSIYYHVQTGLLRLPLPDEQIRIPALPPLQPEEMPSFVYRFGSYPAFYDVIVNQYANVGGADWILCNTFYELEPEVCVSLFGIEFDFGEIDRFVWCFF